jgi:hypothetical protein
MTAFSFKDPENIQQQELGVEWLQKREYVK